MGPADGSAIIGAAPGLCKAGLSSPVCPDTDTPARARERSRQLAAQLDALPLGESRLLTGIDGRRYSLLAYRGQLAEPDADDFATAILAVKRRNVRLGEFIDRFTTVVKMPAPELRPTALHEVVDDILWLNREACAGRGIALAWARCDEVPLLMLDVQLMEQALLNIVKNAMEAVMEAGAGDGFIRVELAQEERRVRLSVVDSGGLLEATPVRQLFTPFFSTKKGGQGIGLMFVREVLQRHGCTWSLAAGAPGETRFDIWLPVN